MQQRCLPLTLRRVIGVAVVASFVGLTGCGAPPTRATDSAIRSHERDVRGYLESLGRFPGSDPASPAAGLGTTRCPKDQLGQCTSIARVAHDVAASRYFILTEPISPATFRSTVREWAGRSTARMTDVGDCSVRGEFPASDGDWMTFAAVLVEKYTSEGPWTTGCTSSGRAVLVEASWRSGQQ